VRLAQSAPVKELGELLRCRPVCVPIDDAPAALALYIPCGLAGTSKQPTRFRAEQRADCLVIVSLQQISLGECFVLFKIYILDQPHCGTHLVKGVFRLELERR